MRSGSGSLRCCRPMPGGIVLARALDDHELFQVALRRERDDLVAALAKHEAK